MRGPGIRVTPGLQADKRGRAIVANQWGRDSGGQSGGPGRRVMLALAVFIAMDIGLAGGYLLSRLFGPNDSVTIERLTGETARLENELKAAEAELSQAQAAATAQQDADETGLRETIDRQARDLDALTEQLATVSDERQAAVTAAEAQADAVAALQDELAALRDSASAGQGALADEVARLRDGVIPELTDERDRLAQELQAANGRAGELEAQVAALDGAKADAEARISTLESELAAAQQALAEALARPAETTTPPEQAEPSAGETTEPADATAQAARDPAEVEAALRNAPGLATLSQADRQRLKDALVAGECVTTALEAVFADVPILALRNLIRDLNSGC